MDARRRERELIGLRGVSDAWTKSPTRIEQCVFVIEYVVAINLNLKILF